MKCLMPLNSDVIYRNCIALNYIYQTNSIISIVSLLTILISCQLNTSSMDSDHQNSRNPYYSRTDTAVLNLSDAEWEKVLPDSVYLVARNKGTERAFTGKYWDFTGLGTYYCAVCGNKLFRSDGKFASSCGWPSFFETSSERSVLYQSDNSYGMERTEVLCKRCGSHLGHLFDDGPPPTFKRFCMNSLVLDFDPDQLEKEKDSK